MHWCIVDAARTKPAVAPLPLAMLWARARALPAVAIDERRDGAALYRIFGSSGTTGSPKFVPISAAAMAARVQGYLMTLGAGPVSRICAIGYGNSVGFTAMLRTFWTGGTLVLTEPARTFETINRYRVETMVIAPMSLQSVLASAPASAPPPPSLATIEFGGSILPPQLQADVERRLCRTIISNFGTSETGCIASSPLAALGADRRAVGVLVPGAEVEAVDGEGHVCAPGVEGALRVRTLYAAPGYVADPAGSAASFRDGWFQTGDIGAVTRDGVLRVSGRVSDIINTGGTKIRPADIEAVLLGLPNVTDAAAFGVPDALGLAEPWAAIVATAPVSGAVLDAAFRDRGGRYAPRQVLQVSALPRNANGKVLRDELVRVALEYRRRTSGTG